MELIRLVSFINFSMWFIMKINLAFFFICTFYTVSVCAHINPHVSGILGVFWHYILVQLKQDFKSTCNAFCRRGVKHSNLNLRKHMMPIPWELIFISQFSQHSNHRILCKHNSCYRFCGKMHVTSVLWHNIQNKTLLWLVLSRKHYTIRQKRSHNSNWGLHLNLKKSSVGRKVQGSHC